MASDDEAVEAANESFYRALESRRLPDMDVVWAADDAVTCIHPGWHRLEGWEEVRRSWKAIFANSRPWKASCEDVHVLVDGDMALVVCGERLETLGGEGEPARMQATNVFRRFGERWRMVHHHATPLPEIPDDEDEESVN